MILACMVLAYILGGFVMAALIAWVANDGDSL